MEGQQQKGSAGGAVAASKDSFATSAPVITLPKGGGAIRGMGEKFTANPVTGTGSHSVPIPTSPGRSGFGPQLSLSYDSGAGNGPFGLGWNLALPAITRKTDKGLPRYLDAEESDVFILAGAEDLVPEYRQDPNGSWVASHPGYQRDADGFWVRDPQGRLVVHEDERDGYRVRRYRPRIEGLFARIERWTKLQSGEVYWRSISRDNVTTFYGKSPESRIADPADPARVFSWLVCETYDDKGNASVYEYKSEDAAGVDARLAHERNRSDVGRSAQCYLKCIKYGNRVTRLIEPDLTQANWLFEVVFDYGEDHYETLVAVAGQHQYVRAAPTPGRSWRVRPDPFSSYRASFDVRTYRRCERILMFHRFDELGNEPYLVSSTEFDYADLDYQQPVAIKAELAHKGSTRFASTLRSVTQSGYVRDEAQAPIVRNGARYFSYLKKSLPPLEFDYSQAIVREEVEDVASSERENLPIGLDGSTYRWTDLDGEGLSGILTEQGAAWFYKRNLSAAPATSAGVPATIRARFAPLEPVARLPAPTKLSSGQQFLDLAGDGQVDVVEFDAPVPGYFERTDDFDWEPFRSFEALPAIDWKDPNLKFIDLTGDGHADILISEDDVYTWHASLAELGFAPAQRVRQALDEEKGPRVVFADASQSIYLADMSGDGLTDIVRIRNGEVCYWPNLGYGRFGAKVTMDQAPWFDAPDQFDQRRIQLADVDGSGVNDVIYLAGDGVRLYFNQSGNRWSDAYRLAVFAPTGSAAAVTALDLLGNGTACLVWSSSLAGDARRPMRYLRLMEQKPHLLVQVVNNLGAETRVRYAPSTKFYLEDKAAGKPWITKLHFPVHVVERVETYDHVSGNRFVTRYAYHHGYFDGVAREFRGFGMVEQFDTEEFAALGPATNVDAASHVPPMLTRTWFHTGIYLGRGRVSNYYAGLLDASDVGEYYREPGLTDAQARAQLLDDTVLSANLSLEEEREACRALKGAMLRQEVYALDESGKEQHPYTVSEQNFTVRCLQPRGANPHTVFFTHARETLRYHYERNPADPRMNHDLTLEVDTYGQVRKSLAVAYGRRAGQSPLAGDDRSKQEQIHIAYTETDVTNPIDDAVLYPDDYRAPRHCEARTYEVTGFTLPANATRLRLEDFTDNNFQTLTNLAAIAYEQPTDYTKKQKRLIECLRTLFRKDDLSALLPKGVLESLALPGESYRLALTPGLLDQVYVRGGQSLLPANVADLLDGGGADRGGYVDLDGDGHWWMPSGRVFYSPNTNDTPALERAVARPHFYLTRRYRSAFHQNGFSTETLVTYDAYDLLVRETRDALGNRITAGTRRLDDTLDVAGHDYRVLQPRVMMDANRNRSEVVFDALGLVVGTAVQGSPEDNPPRGDRIDADFQADLTDAEIEAFYAASDPHAGAAGLLKRATARIVYDPHRFRRSSAANPQDPTQWQPVFAATVLRETHAADAPPSGGLKLQLTFSYSDGYAREIQRKVQAEPGPVPQRDALGRIIVGADGRPQMTTNDVRPRWIGSGWIVYNNKAKPVRQFEPFFSDRHRPDFDVRIGVSPVLFYDPLERITVRLHANHAWEKAVFDPWQQRMWDVNDTVRLDPRNDPDVRGYVARYFVAQAPGWQTWLQQRIADPQNPPPDSLGADPEQDAAMRTLAHADTPATAHYDALGRQFLSVADNGADAGGNPQKYESRSVLDIEGNARALNDARARVIMRNAYDMLGNRVYHTSMEAGARWTLLDVTGKPIRTWDDRGHEFRLEYDALRRSVRHFVRGRDATRSDPRTLNRDVLFEQVVYGEGVSNAVARNLRARVYQQYNGAGIVTHEEYDFKGNSLRTTRELAPAHRNLIDWSAPTAPGERFTGSVSYDALNRPVTLSTPDGSVARPAYNEASLLQGVQVNLRGSTSATAFVTNIDYDAKGQRTRIDYATRDGSGITTTYGYDPLTWRLVRLQTRRNATSHDATDRPGEVQNLRYCYDPAGNVTDIRDDAQPTVFFDGQVVAPHATYVYDALYRLIEASGREHRGQAGRPQSTYNDAGRVNLAHPHDGQAMRNYTERYAYDEVGNLLRLIHEAANGNWTRVYVYDEPSLLQVNKRSNRLTRVTIGAATETYSTNGDGYDAHGNLRRMPQLQVMQWDFRDRLYLTQRQATSAEDEEGVARQGERTYYVYDATGQRVRKVTERSNGTLRHERIYLAGFELYREYDGNGAAVTLARETLHIMDDKRRIALVETKTAESGLLNALGRLLTGPQTLIRYQFGNHLDSCALELDDDAQIVSYEEYTPYGSTSYQAARNQTEAAKRHRYTGKERDEESGFYYHGARYYAPWLCRWTSCDPAGLVDGDNLYAYVRGSPTRYGDPSGKAKKKPPTPDPELTFQFDGEEVRFEGVERQNWKKAWKRGQDATMSEPVQFDVDEPEAVGKKGLSKSKQYRRATNVNNRQLLDSTTNRVSKGTRTEVPITGKKGAAAKQAVSVVDDPGSLFSRKFGEVKELGEIFEEAKNNLANRRDLRPVDLKNEINTEFRRLVREGTSDAAKKVRGALDEVGFDPKTLRPRVQGRVLEWLGKGAAVAGAFLGGYQVGQGVNQIIEGKVGLGTVDVVEGGANLGLSIGTTAAVKSGALVAEVGAAAGTLTVAAGVAAAASVALAAETARAAIKGEQTPIDIADKFYGTHFGDIYGWVTGAYSNK